MVAKKKTSHAKKHASHKVHETKKAEKNDMMTQLLPKDDSAWITAGIFLLIGLIVGALVVYGAMPQTADETSVEDTVDLVQLKSDITEYINTNLIIDDSVVAKISDVNDLGNGLYELAFVVEQDGVNVGEGFVYSNAEKLILGSAFDLDEPIEQPTTPETQEPTEVAKAEVAEAELFVWGYCPGGISTLDTFAEAANELKDVAIIKIVPFHDGHGPYETQQNKIMLAIQRLYPEKTWDYMMDFYEDVYPICTQLQTVECTNEESIKLMDKVGIDSNQVMTLVEEGGDVLYQEALQRAADLGIGVSPTLVVNNTNLGSQFDRTSESIKNLICSGFEIAPDVCNVTLSEETTTSTGTC